MLATTAILIAAALFPILGDENEATVRFPGGAAIRCEIADSPTERGIGLSRHESLLPGRGMLFVYPQPRLLSFWMPPRMRFSIDIIFVDKDRRVIHIDRDCPPCPDPNGWDCPSYGPADKPSLYVVEVSSGTAQRIGLTAGDPIEISLPPSYHWPRH